MNAKPLAVAVLTLALLSCADSSSDGKSKADGYARLTYRVPSALPDAPNSTVVFDSGLHWFTGIGGTLLSFRGGRYSLDLFSPNPGPLNGKTSEALLYVWRSLDGIPVLTADPSTAEVAELKTIEWGESSGEITRVVITGQAWTPDGTADIEFGFALAPRI